MEIDLLEALQGLATRRPIFHSEADFQFELAWHLRTEHSDLDLRLEFPLERPSNEAIDILVRQRDQWYAIELKYLCKRIVTDVAGEVFALKSQGAHDIRRYDVVKDISRMERFVAANDNATAAVVVLTNDPSYWTGPRSDSTCDADFALREGRLLHGLLAWSARTGDGTKRGRERPINIAGHHEVQWTDYSRVEAPSGRLRFFKIEVTPGLLASGAP
jgi:hypothetical protein